MREKIAHLLRALISRKITVIIDCVPLTIDKNPSVKKIVNWLKTESSILFKPATPWGYPTILQIEPSNRCNLHCPMCPVSKDLGRHRGDMDFSLFQRLVDELQSYLLVILFWDWGEPFLNPRSYEMIKYAADRGIKVITSTNGHVFADPKHATKIVDSHLDVLVFSVDGLEQPTYEKIRRSGKLALVLEGIKNVVREKQKHNRNRPRLNLRFIVNKHNEHEVPQVESLASSLGVDILSFRRLHAVPEPGSAFHLDTHYIPEDVRFQLPQRPNGDTPHRLTINPCKNLWNCPTVHWDGTVCSCFMDYNEQRPLGNLHSHSFKEIWYGKAYQTLRRKFRSNWRETPLCNQCSNGFLGGDIGRDATAQAIFLNHDSII